jgi:Ca2+/Na+ antiporter
MALNLLLLLLLALAVVALTRLMVRGIEIFASAGLLSSKTKGQFLGYATSTPELVGTVGTAANGLLAAGLWNVASSNIINVTLFMAASLWYARARALFKRKFADEMIFALVALAIPLVLSAREGLARSPWSALLLLGGFALYLLADKRFNPAPPPSFTLGRSSQVRQSRARAWTYTLIGIAGIVLAGRFLGDVAESVVVDAGVPQWAVGWMLGFITSLPEMTAFFAVFASARQGGVAGDDTDCQENLDSLAASNVANLCLIYPIGVGAFLMFAP